MSEKIQKDQAVFKWVQHIPIGELKKLEEIELINLRRILIKEVRQVGRALDWIEGVIKLKNIEQKKVKK